MHVCMWRCSHDGLIPQSRLVTTSVLAACHTKTMVDTSQGRASTYLHIFSYRALLATCAYMHSNSANPMDYGPSLPVRLAATCSQRGGIIRARDHCSTLTTSPVALRCQHWELSARRYVEALSSGSETELRSHNASLQ